jgi:hypothetical protein
VTPHAVRRDATVAGDARTVARALQRFVAKHGRVVVRPTCRLPALGADIMLLRDVIVGLEADAQGWRVKWSPADGGSFPRLTGTLVLAEDGGATTLRLDGNYDGPATAFADTKDAEIGIRLVHATAAAMLAKLVDVVTAEAIP